MFFYSYKNYLEVVISVQHVRGCRIAGLLALFRFTSLCMDSIVRITSSSNMAGSKEDSILSFFLKKNYYYIFVHYYYYNVLGVHCDIYKSAYNVNVSC
jgi:hypothetical protein